MTAQFSDLFLIDDIEYFIVRINGKNLFNPKNIDLYPVGVCSACWSGYISTYKLHDNELILETLQISLGDFNKDGFHSKNGSKINSVKPVFSDENSLFNNIYENLNLKIEFSGGILIAKNFISSLYVHMRFHPAWKYEEIHELIFYEGNLIEIHEISENMKEIRDEKIKDSKIGYDTKKNLHMDKIYF